ncbi:MAG: hypothetical protein KatS3mg081_0601 [Gemmatimonadales bacterium]|nr:MAG: hypothetical protein KatS3mg081_0601 [Gemmatimonadales bacterium]
MTRSKLFSWSTGERGRNRVRVFEHPKTRTLFLEFREEDGRRVRVALGHRDREAAKAKAEEVALALRNRIGCQRPVSLTLAELFDNYLREVTPLKGPSKRYHDRRAAQLFLECLGPGRKVSSLTRRDWDRFIRWRRARGDLRRPEGGPIGARVITYDLKTLLAALNWAVAVGWIDRNPLRGAPFPKNTRRPRRPVLSDEEYRAMLTVAREVNPVFELALVLVHETGHRLNSVLALRWSDLDLVRGRVRWRADADKMGIDHETVLTAEAVSVLQRARAERPRIGDGPVLAHPKNPGQVCSRYLLLKWWRRAEKLARIEHQEGRGFHSLRRKFATELKGVPLKDLCALGGWKDPRTVLECYQAPDELTMRRALENRAKLSSLGLTPMDTPTDTRGINARYG